MNRKELCTAVAKEMGVSVMHAEDMLRTFFDVIAEQVRQNETVTVTGVGTFRPVLRNAREGVDPITHERIQIAASKTVGFTCGKNLKERVQ